MLITNARILNPFGTTDYIDNGFILIKNGVIIKIAAGQSDDSSNEIVNLKGKTVLPGMINAHTHLYSSLALGMPVPKQQPKNFQEILKFIWWKLDAALDENTNAISYKIGLMDSLRNGVTTVIDHHSSQNFIKGSLALLADTAAELGVNISLAFETSDRNGNDRFKSGCMENLETIKKYAAFTYVWPLFGMHASFTLSDDSLKYISEISKNIENFGIHVHLSEDNCDELNAQGLGYKSVIDRLSKFNLLNKNSYLIHGIHMQDFDIDTIMQNEANLIHNPTSNANNGVGILPSSTINTVNAGLGTDGKQSNILMEANEGHLIRNSSPNSDSEKVDYIELLFKNNPTIIKKIFKQKVGHLDTGYKADLVIYDYQPKTEINNSNYLSHIQFGLGTPSDVITNGQFQIRNNEFISIDESKIKQEAKLLSKQLWDKM